MKSIVAFTAVVSVASTVLCNSPDSQQEFTIVGTYIGDGSSEYQRTETKPNEAEAVDLSTANVVVSYETTTNNGEVKTIELASGKFVDGKVELKGKIDQPTHIMISVQRGESEPLSLSALAIPGGEEISFALLDFRTRASNQLSYFGSSRNVKDTSKKFSISGSLNHPYKDLSRAVVKISAIGRRDFSQADELLGEVILDAGQFLFESEIDEPTAVRISVEIDNRFATTPAVIEPGSKVTVSWYGSTDEILATSVSERHLNLVESWQQSKDYLARVDAHFDAGSSGKRNSQANKETATESATQIQSPSSPSSTDKKNEAETSIPKLSPPQPSVECEHVSMNDFQPGLMELMRRSMSRVATSGLASLKQEIAQFKADSLEHRAKNSEDPFDSLLAVEMGAFGDLTPNRSDALPILDKIAKSLDEDVVARRVVPRHTRLANDIAAESNDDTLVQGQKVPNFALADLQEEVVSLYDVLEEKTVVLIDFWASWCAPCIEKFPVLKEIYADYSDEEFEIVSVSIDSYMESWRESSLNQDLPWINLGEIEGMQGPTAVDYGVRFLPKSYIVDTHGCILRKDLITAEEIWQFLDSHFDQEKTQE